ncbi:hypothetical protein TWF694_010524 [Orbilia ellipsospora]|uniref:RlpA-like protein double-psi beta-barrel domain-containing protein n=1 Tax=Orbilia ellipsospora TaxID=2528407 RepID=A0AAV9XA51_9PEZI
MKGLFQTSLAVAAIIIGAQARHAHMHHRRLEQLHHKHHEKRALVVVTKTQEVVEIEYVTRIVYVDPATIQAEPTSSTQRTSFYTSTTRSTTPSTTTTTTTTTTSYVPPPPPPTTTSSTFTTPSLPTEVIPLVVPQSSTTTTTTTTTTPPPPPPTTTTTTTYAPPPAQSTSPATGGGQMYSGQGTYYDCGLGSCGNTNTNADYVVALSHLLMTPMDGGNPNTNPYCGKQVRVFSAMAPEGVVFTVQDKCPGCAGMYDLDICQTPFLAHLGTEAEGRIDITWQWI